MELAIPSSHSKEGHLALTLFWRSPYTYPHCSLSVFLDVQDSCSSSLPARKQFNHMTPQPRRSYGSQQIPFLDIQCQPLLPSPPASHQSASPDSFPYFAGSTFALAALPDWNVLPALKIPSTSRTSANLTTSIPSSLSPQDRAHPSLIWLLSP